MALIGLDVGGTGVKAVAFDDDGRILCSSYCEYDMLQPAPGAYEYDPNAMENAAFQVLREAIAGCAAPVRGIGVSSFGESIVLLDAHDRVLCNTAMYLDTRGAEDLAILSDMQERYAFRAQMGTRPRINHTLVKLRVLARENPEALNRAKKALFIADFILYRLGGAHCTDYSVAATTGGMDVRDMCWRGDLWQWAGLDPAILPRLVAPGTCVGELCADAAQKLGTKPGAKLVIGGLDHIPSSLGCGVTRKGQMMNAIGTVDCACLITDTIDPHRYDGDFLFLPYYAPGAYGGLIANMAGGVLLKWFREHFGRAEKERWKRDGLDFYAEYEKQMAKEPTDLIVLPRFAGYSPRMCDRAGILNLTLSTTNEQIYRAFMEGATYEMYTLLRAYGQHIESVTAVGGGARCDTYMQIRADVFGTPVHTVACDQPGALGNAMTAGVAAGIFSNLDEAVRTCVRTRRTFFPDDARHAFYASQYEKYCKIYDALADLA